MSSLSTLYNCILLTALPFLAGIAVLAAAEAVVHSRAGAQIEELIRDGHFKRARVALQAYLKTESAPGEALWLQSWVSHVWGDYAKAREYAEAAVAANSRNGRFRLRLAEVYIDSARQKNLSVFEQMKLAGKFKEEIEAALALEPGNATAWKDWLQFHLTAPMIAGGSKDKARQAAAKLEQIDPAEGWMAQARISASAKNNEAALDAYRKAVKTNPAHYEARIAFAKALAANEATRGEAREHAEKAMELRPSRVMAYGLLAEWLATGQEWASLDKLLALNLSRTPDNLAPHYYAAVACIEKGGDLQRANRYLRKYLTVEPEPNYPSIASAHWRLGQVAEQTGNREEALGSYREAIRLDASSPALKDLQRLSQVPK